MIISLFSFHEAEKQKLGYHSDLSITRAYLSWNGHEAGPVFTKNVLESQMCCHMLKQESSASLGLKGTGISHCFESRFVHVRMLVPLWVRSTDEVLV